jgi:hypothetical protein
MTNLPVPEMPQTVNEQSSSVSEMSVFVSTEKVEVEYEDEKYEYKDEYESEYDMLKRYRDVLFEQAEHEKDPDEILNLMLKAFRILGRQIRVLVRCEQDVSEGALATLIRKRIRRKMKRKKMNK